MSKSDISDYSRINLMDNTDLMINKIKKAKTDSSVIMGVEALDQDNNLKKVIIKERPEACNLIQIYSAVSELTAKKTLEDFEGKEFSTLKSSLSNVLVEKILPVGDEIKMIKDEKFLIQVLEDGAQIARKEAENNLKEIKNIIGMI